MRKIPTLLPGKEIKFCLYPVTVVAANLFTLLD
jgi:hypothetical protein